MLLDQRIAEAAVRATSALETPLFLTDASTLEANADAVAAAFPDPWLRAYSLKADPEPSLVRRLAARGWAANCVSLGEIAAARDAGVLPSQTTLEGIGKSGAELDAAIAASLEGTPLRWIAVESLDEARDLGDRAAASGLTAERPLRVLLRLNPGIEPGTHAGLAVGRASSKFGMDRIELAAAAKALSAAPGLRIIGVHLHAGSQLRDQVAWRAAVGAALDAYAELAATGALDDAALESDGTLCVGGGLPVDLGSVEELGAIAKEFAATCDAAWAAHANKGVAATPPVRAVEPGRALVASATILLARVLHVRARHEAVIGGLAGPHGSPKRAAECERQVIIDAGMTEIARPALYAAWHPVVALNGGAAADAETLSAVHGPICESTDALGAHLLPRAMARGDLVGILGAGAYADAMRSPYNGRPTPARLTLERDGSLTLERQRGASTEGSPPTRR